MGGLSFWWPVVGGVCWAAWVRPDRWLPAWPPSCVDGRRCRTTLFAGLALRGAPYSEGSRVPSWAPVVLPSLGVYEMTLCLSPSLVDWSESLFTFCISHLSFQTFYSLSLSIMCHDASPVARQSGPTLSFFSRMRGRGLCNPGLSPCYVE